jgi:hypothetical protein
MGHTAAVTHADMDIHNEFIAYNKDLVFYAGKPVLNRVHTFYDVDRNPWSFAGALSYTFKIWEEREGGLLMVDWSSPNNLSNNDNNIVLNAPAADTGIERGRYYYEIEYVEAGGYPVLIAFGKAEFI